MSIDVSKTNLYEFLEVEPFTTEEEINPLAYIEQREISEANMPRP